MQAMIVKLILVGLLATSSVFASSLKGYSEEPKALGKGVERLVSSPVEYQRRSEWSKTSEPKLEQQRVELSKTQERDEQQQYQLPQEQLKLDEQQREEPLTQQREELPPPPPPQAPTKTLRYEAKPQLIETTYESTKELKAPAAKKEEPSKFIEQQRVEQASYEQLQQQQLAQQVELRDYEQRKLEDSQAAAVQFQQQQQQQQFEEQRQIIAKGAAKEPLEAQYAQAPISAEPEPYNFEYSAEGQTRRESGDAQGVVRGQYTLQQTDGTSRVVDYVADRNGFRAQVNTNEFGTEVLAAPAAAAAPALPTAGVKGAPAPAAPAAPVAAAVKGAVKHPQQLIEQAPEPLPQQQITYVEEAPRAAAVKGAVKGQQIEQTEFKAEPAAIKAPAPQPAPAKGSHEPAAPLKTLEEPAAAPAQQHELPAVVKSAELRSPKSIGAAAAPKTRAGFESATAHRPVVGVLRHEYTHSQVVRESPLVHHQPQQPQRAHYVAPARQYVVRPVVAASPVAHYPRQPVAAASQSLLRSQLQHDRYLPTPIQTVVNRAPTNSRAISFYSSNSNNAETSEDLPIGFEKSA